MRVIYGNVDVELPAMLTTAPLEPESESYKSRGLKEVKEF
jgi:hypothetical protein